MAKTEQYTAEQVSQAIIKSHGILTGAAQALGCTRQTVDNYIKKYKTVRDAYAQATEITLDFVETEFLKKIRSGDTTAMIFYLKTRGKHRGYIERVENVNRNIEIDVSKLSNEQLERVANGEDPLQVVLDGYIATAAGGG